MKGRCLLKLGVEGRCDLAAVDGHGVTRLFSYHIAEQVREASLKIVLSGYEQAPLPVHLLTPQGRLAVPKVRAFVDFALPRLRERFSALKAITDSAVD